MRRGALMALTAAAFLLAPMTARARLSPELAMLVEVQHYAASGDLSRLPHTDPRVGAGLQLGVAWSGLGGIALHGLLDMSNPLGEAFTPRDQAVGHRFGLRLRSPWLPRLAGLRTRVEVSGERVHATARYLLDTFTADGWSLQLGLNLDLQLGEAIGLLLTVGHGWEALGDLARDDGAGARLPESSAPMHLDRRGWFLRAGVGVW